MPSIVPISESFGNLSCYQDPVDSRILKEGSLADTSGMTVAKCADAASYHRYIGVEYAEECYPGDAISNTASSDQCNMACSGPATSVCGGSGAILVYQNADWEPPYSKEQISGCIKDSGSIMADLKSQTNAWYMALKRATKRNNIFRRDDIELQTLLSGVQLHCNDASSSTLIYSSRCLLMSFFDFFLHRHDPNISRVADQRTVSTPFHLSVARFSYSCKSHKPTSRDSRTLVSISLRLRCRVAG
jgi:hypothetical protein